MTINNNSVEQINVALLDMDKKIKSTVSKSASASDFKNLEASVDNIKRTLNETKAGLEPGKTYNINISGNAATADKAKEANKLVNALTVNGKTYNGSEAVDAGVQEIENGGTGATDVNGAEFNITAGMKSQTSDFTDTTKITCVQESPSISNGRFFYSSASYLWNYIKDKISSVLGLTSEKVSSYDSHLTNKDNPHSVTKSQVGLDAVVNTGDSATPVSGGTTKFTTGGAYTELNKKVDKVDGKGLSSNDFTDTYKDKLDNIDTTVTTGSSNLVTSGAVSTAISTEVTNRNTAITNAINNLDVSSVGGDGKYISAISETDGKISATSTTMDTAPTANSVNAVTSGGIKTAISTAETNAKNLENATGTLAVANGGTGVTTQADINKAFIGNLNVGNDDVTDGTEFVSSYASDNGFAESNALNKPYKRQFVKVWNYIKNKISSVLGLTETNYGGTADSAKNMYSQTLDLSSLDATKFYPAFCLSGRNFAEVALYSIKTDDYASQNRIHFDISTNGWSEIPNSINIREYGCHDNNKILIGCIGRGTQSGGWAIWLRGGCTYRCFTRNCNLSLKTSDYTYGSETYTVGTNYYGGSNTNVGVVFTPQSTITNGAYSSRPITAPSIKATIGFTGNLTGNVSGTASKVANALTINGQSYDGSSALNINIYNAYDHVVYDDASLLEWANCTDGHMKKVLVKSGGYNMTKGVNLSKAGTGYVFAEQGAIIVSKVPVAFTASYEAAVIYNLYVECDGASSSENSCAFSSVNSLTLYNCGATYTNYTAIVNRSLFEKCICYNCNYNYLNLSDSSSISVKVFYQCRCYNCECLYTISTKSDLAISFNSDSYFYKECHCVSCDAKLSTDRNIKAATTTFACYYNCYDRCVGCLSKINVNSKALTVYSDLYGFLRCQYMSSCKETHTEGYSNIKGIVQCDFISSTSGINGASNTHVGNSCNIQ